MITFKEVDDADGVLKKKIFICPSCGEEFKFYSISPRYCYTCNIHFPDIVQLYKNECYRMKYHYYKGEEKNVGNNVWKD